jgi:DNA-binding GntR family transcriptional regulator
MKACDCVWGPCMPTSSNLAGGMPSAGGQDVTGKAEKTGSQPDKGTRRARNLRGLVSQGVREAIMAGKYPPGSPLGEAELAERFGVSRGPVREALIQLEREYLVRSHPNRGFFVTVLTEREFDERIMLRSVLEPIALTSARQRASTADFAVVRKHLRELEATAARGDQAAYVTRDYEFHLAIWEISGQPLLKEMLMQISAPVFVFESIVADRYHKADYDVVADARAHRSMVDYLLGKTDMDADCCLRPVLDLAMRAERSIVFGKATAHRPVRPTGA